MTHDVEFEPFYSLFVALATHHLCSNATSSKRVCTYTIYNWRYSLVVFFSSTGKFTDGDKCVPSIGGIYFGPFGNATRAMFSNAGKDEYAYSLRQFAFSLIFLNFRNSSFYW